MTYCPICGRGADGEYRHRCPESSLRAIDAANTRAGNEELEPTAPEPFYRSRERRLREGFTILGMAGDME